MVVLRSVLLVACIASVPLAPIQLELKEAMGSTPLLLSGPGVQGSGAAGIARGFVFEDLNRNGQRDPGEPGLPRVRVSNGREIVLTDREGRWTLSHDDDTILFVIKPRGWMTPVDSELQIPRFYYIHKPGGSPSLRFKGVEPTGPLPDSVDFPLYRRPEPNRFTALFFGDTQPRNLREVDYLARDIIEPLVGETHHAFGVTLGDIVFDDLAVTEPLIRKIALIGIPWYNVLGNHDINFDAKSDKHSDEHFERIFGPAYYSFDQGPTHFVVLDNVVWMHGDSQEDRRGRYKAGLGREQFEWLQRDLALVPQNQLVVLMMHIPLTENEDKEQIFRLIEKRPYVLSVAAHTHYQEHRFFSEKDGWRGTKPHHHVVNVTTCGSWWSGAPNPFGVPHTTMRDGAPHGYSVFTFDGNQYSIEYRAANRPASYQMNIHAPDSVRQTEVAGTDVTVNVFGGSQYSKVDLRFGERGRWMPMEKILEEDPAYRTMYERDKTVQAPYRSLPDPIRSPHLWKLKLGTRVQPGIHPIHVRTTDMFGQTYVATRVLRVDP
jgi:hypothetical protein